MTNKLKSYELEEIKKRLEWAKQTIEQYNKHEQNEELIEVTKDIKETLKIIKGEYQE